MKKILIVFGTRPEAIKMAPVVKEFKKNLKLFDTKVCVTGQHKEMLYQVLDFFKIIPDYDLNVMKKNQTLFDLTSNIIIGLKNIMHKFKPDYVFVHGDTTTSMVSSLSAFYIQSKICHVEAGLRTFNKNSPFPEEINRQITGRLADYHFSPTKKSMFNLVSENIPKKNIVVTGNTVIDSLIYTVKEISNYKNSNIDSIKSKIKNHDIILVTGHRRENFGKGFIEICKALIEIVKFKPKIKIIFPVHLNPKVSSTVETYLSGIENIILVKPLAYPEFVWLMNRSKIIISDSGGVQEEAPSLGKPVLVTRNNTERPEAVEAGTVMLVGTKTKTIVDETLLLLNDKEYYKSVSKKENPYGDGKASKRIVDFLKKIK